MKKHNFISFIFIGTIFLFLIMYPVMFVLIQKGIIKPEFSNFYTVLTSKGNILDRVETKVTNLKNNINNKLTNYLFLYSEINQAYPNFKNTFSFSNKEFKPMGTNSDGEFIFLNQDGFYVLGTNQNDEYIKANMTKNINFYNDLSNVVDTYIYLPSRYEFQEFNNSYNLHNMNEVKKEFLKRLDNIKVGELQIKDKDEYQKLFYHTDHHWNSYGAYQGYLDICDLMNLNCKPYDVVETSVTYHGSIGKMVADNKLSDKFTYIADDLTYKVTVEGTSAPANFKPRKLNLNKGTYYDQYVGFYDGLFSEVVYDYESDAENLLILGDSYAWQIDYIIASNFNKTYVLNPKYVPTLDLKAYLKEHHITKVLVLMETQTTIFDNYGYDFIANLGGN